MATIVTPYQLPAVTELVRPVLDGPAPTGVPGSFRLTLWFRLERGSSGAGHAVGRLAARRLSPFDRSTRRTHALEGIACG